MARIEKPDSGQFRTSPLREAWQKARLDKDPDCTSAFTTGKQIIWILLLVFLGYLGMVSGRKIEAAFHIIFLAGYVVIARLSYRTKKARQYLNEAASGETR